MHASERPPTVSVVGRKNSGKTTLVVALAAELKRRGLRVASVKHGHHAFEIDHPGRDSWRHFHEGEVEAVLMMTGSKIALVMRTEEETGPEELIRWLYGGRGYDIVLVEGFKQGPFPKVEVYRRAVHERPLHDPADPDTAGRLLATLTDAAGPGSAATPVIPLSGDGAHVAALADVLQEWLRAQGESHAR